MLREEINHVARAQAKAMNGREILSLRNNLDAYWQATPERRRFYKEYCDELRETADDEETYKTWLEGIHLYYCAQLLEYRRLKEMTDIKKHRVDHEAFVGFLSSFSYAPLAFQ
jgi:hypothetical protein